MSKAQTYPTELLRTTYMINSRKPTGTSVYQIEVLLKGSSPPIWRRFQTISDISLHKLHQILQVVMGWTNSHLYRFDIASAHFGEPDPEYGTEMKDSRRAKLSVLALGEKDKIIYEYDFGDSWLHEILIEKALPAEPKIRYPVCLAGKGACPPEDCGGIWGYNDLLKIIKDPSHEQYDEIMEWLGGEFDPDKFELDEVNKMLRNFARGGRAQ